MKKRIVTLLLLFLVSATLLSLPGTANAHCDTLAGPVVSSARAALEKGDVTPVLKWVKKDDEAAVKSLFNKILAVRTKGPEARELADMYFFETLVRLHRAGEGAPYTGLKPAGEVEPAVAAADKAIESGSADNVIKMMNDAAGSGIRERFKNVSETRKHADESVDLGRKYVAAYVDFTHYVERLHRSASAPDAHEERAGHESPDTDQHP